MRAVVALNVTMHRPASQPIRPRGHEGARASRLACAVARKCGKRNQAWVACAPVHGWMRGVRVSTSLLHDRSPCASWDVAVAAQPAGVGRAHSNRGLGPCKDGATPAGPAADHRACGHRRQRAGDGRPMAVMLVRASTSAVQRRAHFTGCRCSGPRPTSCATASDDLDVRTAER